MIAGVVRIDYQHRGSPRRRGSSGDNLDDAVETLARNAALDAPDIRLFGLDGENTVRLAGPLGESDGKEADIRADIDDGRT